MRTGSATGPEERGLVGAAQGLGERLISTVGTRPPDIPLWTSPVLTLCPLTCAQRVQDLLVILRDV